MGLATVNVTLSYTQMKIEKKNGTKQNPPLLDSLPTYCSPESIFKDFFKNYYIILYQAVNILFLHWHGGGGPRIGEVKCGGSPHLSCNCDQIKMRDYMDKRDTPPKRVTSPIWGSVPPCKHTLCHYHLVISVSMKYYYYEIRIPGSHYYTMCAINMSGLMAIVTTSQSLRKTTSFHGLTGNPKSLRHCKKLS